MRETKIKKFKKETLNANKSCKIDNCDRAHHALGLCGKHYRARRDYNKRQWHNFKYPLKSDFLKHRRQILRKKENKIKLDKRKIHSYKLTQRQQFIFFAIMFAQEDKCWIWPYGYKLKNNYVTPSKINLKGNKWTPPRLSLTLSKGKSTPERNECAHDPILCNNSMCVNPIHLRWASRQENIDDMKVAGTVGAGENNGRSVLTEDDVRAILRDKRSQRQIAEDYPVSISMIHLIKTRKRWSHISI